MIECRSTSYLKAHPILHAVRYLLYIQLSLPGVKMFLALARILRLLCSFGRCLCRFPSLRWCLWYLSSYFLNFFFADKSKKNWASWAYAATANFRSQWDQSKVSLELVTSHVRSSFTWDLRRYIEEARCFIIHLAPRGPSLLEVAWWLRKRRTGSQWPERHHQISWKWHYSKKNHCNGNCNDLSDYNDIIAPLNKLVMLHFFCGRSSLEW